MEEDDQNEYKTSGSKVPLFDGESKNWPFFKKKMESYIARLGMSDLLSEATGNHIPLDTDPVPAQDPAKKEHNWKMRNNRKAAGIQTMRCLAQIKGFLVQTMGLLVQTTGCLIQKTLCLAQTTGCLG